MKHLIQPTLRLLIDGRLEAGASTLDVINPASACVFAAAPRASVEQARSAIAAGRRPFTARSALPADGRRLA